MERGELSEAERRLGDAVRYNKNDINYRRHYADVLWQQKKYQESLIQLDEALQRGGQNNASLHISIAEKYVELGEYMDGTLAKALYHADEAVRLDSQDYRSWALRGKAKRLQASQQAGYIEHSLAMFHQAREDYLRAVSLSPNNRVLLMELATLQMACGQPEQALASWQTLQNLYPLGGEPNEVLIGKTETLTVLQRFDEVKTNLMTIRQRGLEHSESAQRLQAMIGLGVQR